jgi:hypothetical protein
MNDIINWLFYCFGIYGFCVFVEKAIKYIFK